jgi:hypothetical protein
MRCILIVFHTTLCLACHGQIQTIIDGDKIHLRDSLNGKVVLLSYIEKGEQNREALWITYDRRPGVDPWIREAVDRETKYSEDNFIKYWKERDIRILGAITTYDDCQCGKHKTMSSPDMFLIHFKIFSDDWGKLKEIYPEIQGYIREVKLK